MRFRKSLKITKSKQFVIFPYCYYNPAQTLHSIIHEETIMQFVIKLLISITIIVFCTQIGRKFPTLGGLIATMPLTGVIVLVWLYSDNPGNFSLMEGYTKGALWGIAPTILFFIAVYVCFHKHLSLSFALSAGFSVWFLGALVHQWFLR